MGCLTLEVKCNQSQPLFVWGVFQCSERRMLGDVHLCAVCLESFGAGFSPGFTGQRAQIISNYHAPHLEYSTKNFVACVYIPLSCTVKTNLLF